MRNLYQNKSGVVVTIEPYTKERFPNHAAYGLETDSVVTLPLGRQDLITKYEKVKFYTLLTPEEEARYISELARIVYDNDFGVGLISDERQRQVHVEGFDIHHDAAAYDNMQLAGAAGCYIANALNKHFEAPDKARFQIQRMAKDGNLVGDFNDAWPWADEWDKRGKHDIVRSLVIAGALIAAQVTNILERERQQMAKDVKAQLEPSTAEPRKNHTLIVNINDPLPAIVSELMVPEPPTNPFPHKDVNSGIGYPEEDRPGDGSNPSAPHYNQ